MSGWVKFHRKIEEWEWYTDENTFRLFFHLVIKSNHKPKKWHGIQVETGQLITSLDKLSAELKLTVQQIRTSIRKLKSTGEITIKSTNKYTLVTVENYSVYQSLECESTIKSTNNETNEQQTNNNNQELKELNKIKKHILVSDVDELWTIYPRKEGKADAYKKIPKLLEIYSKDQIINAINFYKKETIGKDKQYILQGSTFFNGRILDYINQDLEPEKRIRREIIIEEV